MQHIRKISVAKAQQEQTDIDAILDDVFSFVLELVDRKGKDA